MDSNSSTPNYIVELQKTLDGFQDPTLLYQRKVLELVQQIEKQVIAVTNGYTSMAEINAKQAEKIKELQTQIKELEVIDGQVKKKELPKELPETYPEDMSKVKAGKAN